MNKGHEMKTVFFYGLFMDENLLKEKGFHPTASILAYVDGYALKIGERATLVKAAEERAYGSIVSLSEQELSDLYGEASVADYFPESILATTFANQIIEVVAYNLPLEKLAGQNRGYAQSLAKVASGMGLPADYVEKIELIAGKNA